MFLRIFCALSLLLLTCPIQLRAGFEGDYDDVRWTFQNYGGDGLVDWMGDFVILDSGYSGSGTLAQADLTARATKSGTVHFDWLFYGDLLAGYRFQWIRNGTATTMASRQEYAEGSSSFPVVAGDTFGFRVTAPKDEFSGTVEISTFFAPGQEPQILLQPRAQSGCLGEFVTFEVTATNAFDYQWQFKGQNIAGANFDDLDIRVVPPADTGNYRVVVRNPLGNVTSQAVPLVIKQPPSIAVQPPTAIARCAGESVAMSVSAHGTNLHYQWLRDGLELNGATAAGFSLAAVTTNDSGNYTVAVSNECGTVLSTPLRLTVLSVPVITLQPMSQSRFLGEAVSFAVALTDATFAQCQWRRNGTNLIGATNASLALANLELSDAGIYSVLISNPCGAVTSDAASLIVNSDTVGMRIVCGTNRAVSIEVLGTAGWEYVLETSTNFSQWTAISTNVLVVPGAPLFYDTASDRSRFYRVKPFGQ